MDGKLRVELDKASGQIVDSSYMLLTVMEGLELVVD
jgi:hypothetical protein